MCLHTSLLYNLPYHDANPRIYEINSPIRPDYYKPTNLKHERRHFGEGARIRALRSDARRSRGWKADGRTNYLCQICFANWRNKITWKSCPAHRGICIAQRSRNLRILLALIVMLIEPSLRPCLLLTYSHCSHFRCHTITTCLILTKNLTLLDFYFAWPDFNIWLDDPRAMSSDGGAWACRVSSAGDGSSNSGKHLLYCKDLSRGTFGMCPQGRIRDFEIRLSLIWSTYLDQKST